MKLAAVLVEIGDKIQPADLGRARTGAEPAKVELRNTGGELSRADAVTGAGRSSLQGGDPTVLSQAPQYVQ